MSEPDQIIIPCPACGERLRVARGAIGTQVGCPSCQAIMTVRDPAATTPVPMITDPRRKLGMAPRGGEAPVTDPGFKDRLRTTAEPNLQVDPDNPVMKRRDERRQKHGDTLTDWDRQPRRHHRPTRARRLKMGLSAACVVLAVALAAIFWQRMANTQTNHSVVTAGADRPLELQAQADFRDEVWMTVQKFCASSSPEAFLPLLRDPERVGPLLKRFYNSENPWIPLPLARRPDLTELEVHRNFVVFALPLNDFGTRPIALEKTPAGFRIDWESFVGYSDLSWSELRRTRPRHPVLLRAVIKPSDYFNLDFQSAGSHRCYQISDLNSDHVLYGYITIGSDAELQIRKILLNTDRVNAVLRVRYPQNSTNDRQLEITEVLEKGWIFREDDIPETPLEVSPFKLERPETPSASRGNTAGKTVLPGLTSP